MSLRVLVACEFSGVVRDAFTAAGHDATSCDLLDSETPGRHYKGDVEDLISRTYSGIAAAMAAQWGSFGERATATRRDGPIVIEATSNV